MYCLISEDVVPTEQLKQYYYRITSLFFWMERLDVRWTDPLNESQTCMHSFYDHRRYLIHVGDNIER